MNIVINVSDARASSDVRDVLTTYSLGSCIGVTVWDPVVHAGGMLHYQLPTSTLDAALASANPAMFADTGMAALLALMASLGADRRRLKIHLAGGSQMLNDNQVFDIGRRNHVAIRKILWQMGVFIQGEDVGGSTPRNLVLAVADGTVTVKAGGQTKVL